jgi:hypothetical protein
MITEGAIQTIHGRRRFGLWLETIKLDMESREMRTSRGIAPILKTNVRPIPDGAAVLLSTRNSVNFVGDPVSRGSVWISDGEKKWRIEAGELDAMTTLAYEIGGKLRIPVDHAAWGTRNTARILTWSTWMAMMAVILVMLWPTLNGSRPIRLIDWNRNWNNSYQEPAAISQYRNGLTAYYRNDFEQAERLIRKALEDRPHNAAMMNMLAYAQAGRNKLDEALNTARNALAADPKNGNIADTVAEMLQRRGEFEDAAVMYEEALRLQDTQTGGIEETHTKYGETLLALGRRREALKELNRASQFGSQWAARAREVLAGKVTDFRKP